MSDQARMARNIPLYYLFHFFREFQVWIPVWIVFLTLEQGFSFTEVTVAEGLFLVAIVVLEVPTGVIADRWGRRTSVGLGALALCVALALFAVTSSFPVLLASFLTWSLAMALMSGADLALLFDSLKALGREQEYERHAGAGQAVSWGAAALGTVAGGPLAAWYGSELTIWLGVITTFGAAAVAFAMAEPLHQAEGEPHPSLRSIARAAADTAWHNRPVRLMLLISGAIGALLGSAQYLIQPFLLSAGVEVGITFSLLQVPQLLGGMVGSMIAYRIMRLAGESALIVVFAAIGTGAYAGLALTNALGWVALFPLIAILEAAVLPVATGFINRRVGSEQRATILSMHSFVGSLFAAPLIPLIGASSDSHSPRWALGLLGLLLAGAAVMAVVAWLSARGPRDELAAYGGPAAAGEAP